MIPFPKTVYSGSEYFSAGVGGKATWTTADNQRPSEPM